MKGLLFIAAVLCGTEKAGRPVSFMCSVVNTAQTILVWMNRAAVNQLLCVCDMKVKEIWCVCVRLFALLYSI